MAKTPTPAKGKPAGRRPGQMKRKGSAPKKGKPY
jgi:hypothetical protein